MSTSTHIVEEALGQFPTPFFLFDEEALQAQVAHLRSLLGAQVDLCYAMKANSFVLAEAARAVERIEVCSTGEARTCFALGIPDEMLVISGVHKDPAFMRELVEEHPHIGYYTVESCAQFDLLAQLAQEAERPIRLLMRLTSGNQFGITARELKACAQRCRNLAHVEFCGIQFYSGTQKTSLKRLKRELGRIDKLVTELEDECRVPVRELEFGPGFPVSYYGPDEDARAEQDVLTSGLRQLLDEMTFSGDVTLELGRALVASCGTYVTSVVDTKRNKTGNYAIVDGGKHQFVYFGNALSMQLPPCTVLPERAGEPEPWNVCGSLCTVNDILVKQMVVADLKVGDALAFARAGAYCMTEGISLFLSRDLPRVVIRAEDGTMRLARDRIETYTLNTPA